MGKGIDIWKRKVYDLDGVCLITQICLRNINNMYISNIHDLFKVLLRLDLMT